jgi:hypothetical protein
MARLTEFHCQQSRCQGWTRTWTLACPLRSRWAVWPQPPGPLALRLHPPWPEEVEACLDPQMPLQHCRRHPDQSWLVPLTPPGKQTSPWSSAPPSRWRRQLVEAALSSSPPQRLRPALSQFAPLAAQRTGIGDGAQRAQRARSTLRASRAQG